MTFISKSPKYPPIYKSVLAQLGRVGPGSYNPWPTSKENMGHGSQYIFNSKMGRTIFGNGGSLGKDGVGVGPGRYQPGQAFNLIKKQIQSCQYVFKSHQNSPLPTPSPNHQQHQLSINIYKQLLHSDEANKKIGKLHHITRQTRKISQSIPSIPSCEQSYGYRVDYKTKKLVQNQNPNQLLAKKYINSNISLKQLRNAENQSKNTKSPKNYKTYHKQIQQPQPHSKYHSNQQEQQMYLLYKYGQKKSILDDDIKKWHEKGNNMTNKQNRFNEKHISKKQLLLIHALKQKYQGYVGEEGQLEEIVGCQGKGRYRWRDNGEIDNGGIRDGRVGDQVECFGSKQKRFQERAFGRGGIQRNIPITDHSNLEHNEDKPSPNNPKSPIIPFGSIHSRFPIPPSTTNLNLGPGTYTQQLIQNSPSDTKGIEWSKQQQERFKNEELMVQLGPGYYHDSTTTTKKWERWKQGQWCKRKDFMRSSKEKQIQNMKEIQEVQLRVVQTNEKKEMKKFQGRKKENKNDKKNRMKQEIRQKKKVMKEIRDVVKQEKSK